METERLKQNIELFAQDKLQGEELKALEEAMRADPRVASEVYLQKDIIQGIRRYRINLIKQRLNNVDISSMSSVGSQAGSAGGFVKAASVILVGASLGLVSYLGFNGFKSGTESQYKASIGVENTDSAQPSASPESVPGPASSTSVNESQDIQGKVQFQEQIQSVTPEDAVVSTKKVAALPKKKLQNMENRFAEAADPGHIEKQEVEAPAVVQVSSDINKTADYDISTVQDGVHKFHYTLTNHQLTLYGKFNKGPYEILEFGQQDTPQLYFFYQNHYYFLNETNGDITKFRKIEDMSLLQKLNRARNR